MGILVRPGTCIICGHWSSACLFQKCKNCRRAYGKKMAIQRKQGKRAAEAWEAARLKRLLAANPPPPAPETATERLPGRWGKSD